MVPEKNNKVSILGCGWFGLPFAEKLIQLGYLVKGSTTTPDKLTLLEQKRIKPYLINLVNTSLSANILEFLDSDYLVICFPPRIRAHGDKETYLAQINFLSKLVQQSPRLKQVLFISSTSVYKDTNNKITETDLQALMDDSPLLQAETLFQNQENFKTIVLRFAGLVGGSRHPGRFLAGKLNVPQPHAPVNLLHLDDCIGLGVKIIEGPIQNAVFHAAADEHPTREHFYTAAARALHLPPPKFKSDDDIMFKIIDNSKIKSEYQYQFIHPDPMLFF